MQICNFNVTNLSALESIVYEYGVGKTMPDILQSPYAFFDLVSPHINDINSDFDMTDLPIVLAKTLNIIMNGIDEGYLSRNCTDIIGAILKAKPAFVPEYNALKDRHNSLDICICMLVGLICEDMGLAFVASELDGVLPVSYSSSDSVTSAAESGRNKQDSEKKPEGFYLDNDRLMYRDTYVRNIKTVAAEGAQCAYLDDGGVCVIDYYGDKNVYRLSGVGDIALDGDGGVVCLKKPYFEGVENLCAVSDEEYPEVSAVAVSVCGYQYAVLLHDGAVRSNIPWSHKAMAEKVPLTAISVSENLVLGITRDHRVFSSDDGIIGFENARKAVMFGNSVAVLLLNGNVYIGKSNHCVASDVSDIEACKNGLYMLQDDAICMIDSNGHKRVVAEEAASEFAVSESKLIYRKKNGGIEFCDL